jgi:hypothetical protein
MHYARNRRHGDPAAVITPVRRRGSDNPAWVGADATYFTVHARLRDWRGPASGYPCVGCGAPAANWSYDHGDPNERLGRAGPYSTDLDRYAARCVRCHRRWDREHR